MISSLVVLVGLWGCARAGAADDKAGGTLLGGSAAATPAPLEARGSAPSPADVEALVLLRPGFALPVLSETSPGRSVRGGPMLPLRAVLGGGLLVSARPLPGFHFVFFCKRLQSIEGCALLLLAGAPTVVALFDDELLRTSCFPPATGVLRAAWSCPFPTPATPSSIFRRLAAGGFGSDRPTPGKSPTIRTELLSLRRGESSSSPSCCCCCTAFSSAAAAAGNCWSPSYRGVGEQSWIPSGVGPASSIGS
mmetsp:Transcript_4863/g.12008  ORF Transcript_4863/g.12008 Transcript_4863/m.12008 type:complete len:250 (+) Transcript_4863:1823-2572(+)